MNIYVARHGQTNYNVLGLCNDNPSRHVYLTETGIKQAEQLATRLSAVNLDVIFISQLPRTRQTARIVNHYHSVRIIECEELNDIHTGFDGEPVNNYFSAVGHDRMNIEPPGGESLRQFQHRVNAFLDVLLMEEHENVLIIAHEETLRVCEARFRTLSPEQMEGLSFDNCDYIQYRCNRLFRNTA
jgi:broad specificity phosphatase PhoE